MIQTIRHASMVYEMKMSSNYYDNSIIPYIDKLLFSNHKSLRLKIYSTVAILPTTLMPTTTI